jgi:uncharacterized protein (TIGR02246 family)
MEDMNRRSAIALGLTAIAATLHPNFATAAEKEEQKIRAINKHWLELVANKNAPATAELYAEDGAILAPGAPIMVGHEAIANMWKNIFSIPGVALTFQTTKFKFSKAKDMAVETGTYQLTTGVGDAKKDEKGKFVVTWVKRGGKWRVYTDMFSNDAK